MPPKKIIGPPKYARANKTTGFKFGAHVGMSGGVYNAVTNALNIGANSFALFLRSPRRWESPPISSEDAARFKSLCKEHGYDTMKDILPHGSYFINLANPDEEKNLKSYETFLDDLKRCEQLGIGLYNFHPGSSLGSDHDAALDKLAENINKAIDETEFVKVVVEIMAGHGNYVCGTLDDIGLLVKKVKNKDRLGICIDTCHAFAGGYDLSSEEAWMKFWKEFEEKVGFEYLASLHINDSMAPLGANRDLHQSLGWGFLTLECFRLLVNDERMKDLPLILETPVGKNETTAYGEEIKLLEWLQGRSKDDAEYVKKCEELHRLGAKSREEQAAKIKKRDEKAAKPKRKAKTDIASMMTKKPKVEIDSEKIEVNTKVKTEVKEEAE